MFFFQSPSKIGFSEVPFGRGSFPGAPRFERPPFDRGPPFPPMRDPFRPPGFGERDLYCRPDFGPRMPPYPLPDRPLHDRPLHDRPYYDRLPYDPLTVSRSGLDYRDRFAFDDRDPYGMARRAADADMRPMISRPVVVDYNHGAPASGDAATVSKQETTTTDRRSSDRDRERRSLEDDRMRAIEYGREKSSLEHERLRLADRSYYDRETLDRDRDRHFSFDRSSTQELVDRARQLVAGRERETRSYERESQLMRERERSTLDRDRQPTVESGRERSGAPGMEVDVSFVRNAIVSKCSVGRFFL
jgi:hypothetical protein